MMIVIPTLNHFDKGYTKHRILEEMKKLLQLLRITLCFYELFPETQSIA